MNAMSVDYFPEEIIHEILLRLPIKPLIRFSGVCNFIDLRLSRTIQSNDQNNTHLLLRLAESRIEKSTVCSLHWDNPKLGEYSKLIYPFVDDRKDPYYRAFEVVGICNGLICLDYYRRVRRQSYEKRQSYYAFGYDSRTKDYKVLRTLSYETLTPSRVEVWSLARGSWNTLTAAVSNIPEVFQPLNYQGAKAFVNGVLHWLQIRIKEGVRYHFITWFDVNRELFGEIAMPGSLRIRADSEFCISRYGDSLALFKNDGPFEEGRRRRRKRSFCVWVMKEYGVVESWTKLFTIRLPAVILILPFCFRKSGEVILKTYSDYCLGLKLVSLNPNTDQVEDLDIDDNCSFMDHFVESIALFGHPDAISY
ncbi:unnamed protein product [Malus baccata var. baccata]